MLRDELVDRLRALPAGVDVGVRVGSGNLEIVDVFPWGKGQFGALACRAVDLTDLFVEWGLTAEQRRHITLATVSAQCDDGKVEDMTGRKLRLVGVGEVQELLGVTEHQVKQLSGFPEPIALLESGKVWDFEDVEEWRRAHGDAASSANDPER